MKKRFSSILKKGTLIFTAAVSVTLLSGMLTSCNNTNTDDKFSFLSAEWGANWEDVQKDTGLTGETQGDEQKQSAEIKAAEYLGVKGTALFRLDKQFENTYCGLYNVIFAYDDVDEEKLIAEMEKIYGERKSSYSDKNGVENPIGSSGGWVSEETIETSLTETEKEKYIEMMGDIEQSRKDAILRSPLVSITADEERNIIEFKGSAAATVKYIKENI